MKCLQVRDFFSGTEHKRLADLSTGFSQRSSRILAAANNDRVPLAQLAKGNERELIVVPEASDHTLVCRYEFIQGACLEAKEFISTVVTQRVREKIGVDIVPFKDKCNEKKPGGGGYPPHQDFPAYASYGPRRHITVMLCVDDATIENGCLQVSSNFEEITSKEPEVVKERIRGNAILKHHSGGAKNGDIIDDVQLRLLWEPVVLKKNDIAIFDSFLPHYSEPNHTRHPRRAWFLTYNESVEGDWYNTYYEDKRENYGDPKFHFSTPTTHL